MKQKRNQGCISLLLSLFVSHNYPVAAFQEIIYNVQVRTGYEQYAGTDARVFLQIYGSKGNTGTLHLNQSQSHSGIAMFEKGEIDKFQLKLTDIGSIERIGIGHDGSFRSSAWFLEEVIIDVPFVNMQYGFSIRKWLETWKGSRLVMVEVETSWKKDYRILYHVQVKTGSKPYAGTDANVYLQIFGSKGNTRELNLTQSENHVANGMFQKGQTDKFKLKASDVGDIEKIKFGHDGTNRRSDWFLEDITIDIPSRAMQFGFEVLRWLKGGKRQKLIMEEKMAWMTDSMLTYYVNVKTGDRPLAKTDANVYLVIYGSKGNSGEIHLKYSHNTTDLFENGQTDFFELQAEDIGKIKKIKIRHDNTKPQPGWFLDGVQIERPPYDKPLFFEFHRWLCTVRGDGLIELEKEPSYNKE